MSAVTRVDGTFTDAWGITIHYHRWSPPQTPRAIVQIAHGLGDHALRYETLAGDLVAAGYEVWAHEHRGHGPTGLEQWQGDRSRLGRLGPGGLGAAIAAIRQFRGLIEQQQPGVPVIFLGHSWGSLMGQILLNDGFGSDIAAAVFSGSSYRLPGWMNAGDLNARHRHLGDTGAEWLSRDGRIQREFASDDLTFRADTLRLFGPLDALRLLGRPRTNTVDIPLLLMVGSDDSLGGERSVRRLERAYRERAGATDVTTLVYPDARHEVFNEINRDEVVADLLSWLDRVASAWEK